MWTWRRTITGLAIALLLTIASATLFAVSEQRRTQIISHGVQTQAVVTYDHNEEFDHWYTVSYTVRGQARTADLRYPWLIDDIPEGQVLTVYVDPDHPQLIATEDGYSTPVWNSAPGFLAVLAIFSVFIAIAGHLTGRRSARRGTSDLQ